MDLELYLVDLVEVVIKVQDLVWMVNLTLVVEEQVEMVLDHQAQVELVVPVLS